MMRRTLWRVGQTLVVAIVVWFAGARLWQQWNQTSRGGLRISLRLNVAHGLPIAEVTRQLDSAIRYAIRQALGREIDSLTIKVAHLAAHPGAVPPRRARRSGVGPADLAESGTDVA